MAFFVIMHIRVYASDFVKEAEGVKNLRQEFVLPFLGLAKTYKKIWDFDEYGLLSGSSFILISSVQ